jgi:uncharacterized protein YcnI
MNLMPPRVAAFILAVLAALPASAHVTIQPKTATVGSQEYVVRVPTEKPVGTTSVRMVFPAGFEVQRFRTPAPGWHYEIERDASGRIAAVTWSGRTIGPDEYELFQFMARTREAGVFKLDAFQTYAGNEVVGWVDDEGQRPAPKVTVQPTAADAVKASDETHPSGDAGARRQTAAGSDPVQPSALGTWLGFVAAGLSLIALWMAYRATRQMRVAR